jgi:uncharacterized protein YutE (UPF0331/DUF86 family)
MNAISFAEWPVHRYWEIMDEKVYASVKRGLKDFEEFIDHINNFCRGEGRWKG